MFHLLQSSLQYVRGMSGHDWFILWLKVTTCASILHNMLPPFDWKPKFVTEGFIDFPDIQVLFCRVFHNRYYKLLIYIVGYVALNGRSTVWAASISIKTQINKAKEDTAKQIADLPSRQ